MLLRAYRRRVKKNLTVKYMTVISKLEQFGQNIWSTTIFGEVTITFFYVGPNSTINLEEIRKDLLHKIFSR